MWVGTTITLIKWKGKSCSDNEAHLCCLGHGDTLVMDGQCQDKFLHCTSPGVEHERMNITFRWVKQHVSSCAQGSSVLVTGIVGNGVFLGFLASPWCLVQMGWY